MDMVMQGTDGNAESVGGSTRIVIQSLDNVPLNSVINISHVSY
jgi:hypothetical protein